MSNADLKFFVGGIPSDVKRRDLYEFFRTYGVVKRVTIFNSDKGKKLFGFCFIKFKKIFVDKLDIRQKFIFQGRMLEVDSIVKRSSLKQSVSEKHAKRVFLQNLPVNLGKDDVIRLFSRYGEIVNCFVIKRDQTNNQQFPYNSTSDNRSQNYGYVIFSTKEEAESLVQKRFIELNNRQRIYIKRYCSTINREVSEDKASPSRGPKSVNLDLPIKRLGTTISIDDHSKGIHNTLLTHHVKPTSQRYRMIHKTYLNKEHPTNLRFNISFE